MIFVLTCMLLALGFYVRRLHQIVSLLAHELQRLRKAHEFVSENVGNWRMNECERLRDLEDDLHDLKQAVAQPEATK